MIAEWVILGGIGFWIWSGIFACMFIWAIDDDSFIGGIVCSVLFSGFLVLFTNFDLSVITDNPLSVLLYVAIYFAIGAVWSIIKWYLHVKEQKDLYNEVKNAVLAKESVSSIDDLDEFSIRNLKLKANRTKSKCQPSENKEALMTWITFWPFSLIWSLIEELTVNLAKRIYNAFSKLYKLISDRVMKGVDDFE